MCAENRHSSSGKSLPNVKDGTRDFDVRRIFSENEAWEIRELQKEATVFRDNYPGYDKWIETALNDVINGNRVAFGVFKAIMDPKSGPSAKLVGSIIIKEEKYGSGVELKNLFVAPSCRGQKYGKALNCAIEKHYSKKLRYRVIKTEVPAHEKDTISFLLSQGYKVLITKDSPHKAGDYVTEMYRELPLKYGGDYYDRLDFFSWLLSYQYQLSSIVKKENYLTFSLKPKFRNDIYNTAGTVTGIFLVNDEVSEVNTETVKKFFTKNYDAQIKMFFGRHISAETKAEYKKQGIVVFDEPLVLSQFIDCFAYPPPVFKMEEIGGNVVTVNGDYIERMQDIGSGKTFTYFKGGSVGKYLKQKDKILFFFTRSKNNPQSVILAFADVISSLDGEPEQIWETYKTHNAVFTEKEYQTFSVSKQTILAIECSNLTWIKPMSQSELCCIIGVNNLDIDDIGHLYLSSKMVIDFLEKKIVVAIDRKKDQTIEKFNPSFGIITALPQEFTAVECMLTESKDITHNKRKYVAGKIASADGQFHSVVVVLVDQGTNMAAARAATLLERFPSIDSLIMVGIAGGVPNIQKPSDHVRVGDIVVSNEGGFIQYDFIKQDKNKIIYRSPPRPPSARLLEAVKLLHARMLKGKKPWEDYIDQGMNCLEPKIHRPDDATDILFSSDGKQELKHPNDPSRVKGKPRVFLGPIGSSNTLLKNPKKRDELLHKFNVKAVEMEASGVADAAWDHNVGVLVVRGICDYCDFKKEDTWQPYAAVIAAAYTRALIESLDAES